MFENALKPLLNELTKFSQDQKQIITLLKEIKEFNSLLVQTSQQNNQLQKLILKQLVGQPPS